MNKEFITLGAIAIALFMGAIGYTEPLHSYFLHSLNGVKSTYFDTVESMQTSIDKHFSQADMIVKLQKDNERYKKEHLLLASIASEYNALLAANKSKLQNITTIHLVRAISYAKFGDRNKVWLEVDEYNSSKMYGLVINENSAGIVVEHLGKPLGLLNADLKTSYAVYVGANKAPGIVRGKNSEDMVVEFIPTWMKINIGDEVKTSGLDKLFFEGIATGIVTQISQEQGYQVATIKPYANTDSLGYMHVIEQLEE